MPRFSIVTPCFRGGPWLKLAIASVADQGIEHEHLIQDAGSDDGTLDWLLPDPRVRVFVEKDKGMYDAVNRGLRRSTGEFLAYLNCDEQYLPGALTSVAEFFQQHPEVEVVFGHFVLVDAEGDYICHRKVLPPLLWHTWTVHLATLTCATFFRRTIIERGLFFDPALRDVGDGEWMVRLLRSGVKMAALDRFTSIFTRTGKNMSVGPNAMRENAHLRRSAPALIRAARPFTILHHRVRRWLGGVYSQAPFSYQIYTQSSPQNRRDFAVARPNFRWNP